MVTVRIPDEDDAPALAGVNVRGWQAAYRDVMPQAFLQGLSVEQRSAGWRRWIASPETWTQVAVDDDGTLLGYVAFSAARDADAAGAAEIVAIYVDPPHWRRGVGAQLMAAAARVIADAGFARTVLWVLQDNPRARAFYERRGFRHDPDGVRSISIGGVELPELRYRRDGAG